MYSKDLSKKIRTAMHTMQKQGKWVGGKTPLGYIKDSNDKNKLIIYEPEAKIVRKIFNMAFAGNQAGVIRDYLNSNNIPTANNSRYNKDTFWENKTVKNIRLDYLPGIFMPFWRFFCKKACYFLQT